MQPASRAANATKCLLLSSLQGKQNEAMGILAPWLLNIDPMMSPKYIKYIFEQLRAKTSLKMEYIMILFCTNDSNKIERLNSSLRRLQGTNYVYRLYVSSISIPLIDCFLPPIHTLIFYLCMYKCLVHVRGKILIKFDEAKV